MSKIANVKRSPTQGENGPRETLFTLAFSVHEYLFCSEKNTVQNLDNRGRINPNFIHKENSKKICAGIVSKIRETFTKIDFYTV